MRRWRLKSKIVSLPKRVASRSQRCTSSSSSSVRVSATISPSGLTMTLQPNSGMPVLDAGLGHGHHPGRVLIGAGLQRELVVEDALLGPLLALLRVDRGRVEAEHDHLDALQAHHAVDLGPAPVIADAHAEDAAHEAPDRKAEVARLEVALLQVLVRALLVELGVAGQVHLAVLADDGALLVDQDRGVEVVPVRRQLGIAEAHAHAVLGRPLEQRPGGGVRHLLLEPEIGLGAVLVIPAREERGQRQLGIDDEVGALGLGLLHQVEHARHHGLARVGLLDGAQLGGGNGDDAGHGGSSASQCAATRRSSRLTSRTSGHRMTT